MSKKNFYGILGIKPDATANQIKSAYREQVKQLHPDYYGENAEPFRELQEAYTVLSDPEKRQKYDEQLSRRQRPRPTRSTSGVSPIEPISPQRKASPIVEVTSYHDTLRQQERVLAALDDLLRRIWREWW